jgi:hypothetical protein
MAQQRRQRNCPAAVIAFGELNDLMAGSILGHALNLTQAAATELSALGAEVREIVFPDPEPLFKHLVDLAFIELAFAHDRTFAAHKDRYGSGLRKGVERGLAAKPLDLANGLIERDKFRGSPQPIVQ